MSPAAATFNPKFTMPSTCVAGAAAATTPAVTSVPVTDFDAGHTPAAKNSWSPVTAAAAAGYVSATARTKPEVMSPSIFATAGFVNEDSVAPVLLQQRRKK